MRLRQSGFLHSSITPQYTAHILCDITVLTLKMLHLLTHCDFEINKKKTPHNQRV